MATKKKKLYQSADELIQGYGLHAPTGRAGRPTGSNKQQKVFLRARILRSGNVQLYLYSSERGKAIRRAIGILAIETTEKVKERNEREIELAEAEAGLRNADAIRTGHGFKPLPKKKLRLLDFIEYMESDKKLSESTRKSLCCLRAHLTLFGAADVRFSEIGRDWFVSFIRYLRTEALNRNATKKKKRLTQNSIEHFYTDLNIVFSRAVEEGIIVEHPASFLRPKEKPKPDREAREYLTTDEVRKMIVTPCSNDNLKRAFLFSVFTGLRWSDINLLRWSMLREDDNGAYFDVTMKKTTKRINVYLSNVARSFLPKRLASTEQVFSLPKNSAANKHVASWAREAGISKHVSFHVARHTFATMMLNNDTSLEVVGKMLGHARLSTTEIYAKMLNRSLATAANKQDDFFKI